MTLECNQDRVLRRVFAPDFGGGIRDTRRTILRRHIASNQETENENQELRMSESVQKWTKSEKIGTDNQHE